MKTDRQTDTAIDIRFMGSETLPSTCYILIKYLSIVCRPHYPALKLRVGGVLQSRFAACMSPSPFCSLQLSNGYIFTRYS